MNAQQAPSRGFGILDQHSLRSEAVQMDSIKTQSRRGGTMDHKIHKDKIVSAELRGDEKRLILIQANGPVVLSGGRRSGCAPTGYFLAESELISLTLTFCKFYALIKPVHEG